MAEPLKSDTIELITLGCRLNISESEAMRAQAKAAGHDNVIIVNSCAVTAEAVRQARQKIRRAKRDNKDASIIVTGCAAQTEPETFAHMDEVDLVLGNDAKTKLETWHSAKDHLKRAPFLSEPHEKIQINDIMSVRETAGHMVQGFEKHTRAFVQVQNGCDHRCTFCIIPYGRGNSRSVPMGEVVEQVKKLVGDGYQEIVLTGVDMTSYGADLPGKPPLGALVQALLSHAPDLKRLRLSSIDSVEADDALIDAFGSDQRMMPHLHLSLQAGDTMILKRMKRRHSREDAIALCADLRKRRPDVVFGADLIAGFPTEDEAMFNNTLKLVDECGLTYLHVFPYSPRKGTPAAKMPQVERSLIKERAKRLREKGEAQKIAFMKAQIGKVKSVLIEADGRGRCEHFMPVFFEDKSLEKGAIHFMQIKGMNDKALIGHYLS